MTPAGGQGRDQLILGERSVLHFVDQQMLQTIVELQGQIGRLFGRPQRALGSQREAGEINPPGTPTLHIEQGDGQFQRRDQRNDHRALAVAEHAQR